MMKLVEKKKLSGGRIRGSNEPPKLGKYSLYSPSQYSPKVPTKLMNNFAPAQLASSGKKRSLAAMRQQRLLSTAFLLVPIRAQGIFFPCQKHQRRQVTKKGGEMRRGFLSPRRRHWGKGGGDHPLALSRSPSFSSSSKSPSSSGCDFSGLPPWVSTE